MAVKYSCTKCGKRFVEWGAEKIKSGEGCPDCGGEFLELVGFDAARAAVKKQPTLKRRRKATGVAALPDKTALRDKAELGPDSEDRDTDGAEESTENIGELEGGGPKIEA